MAVNYTNLFEDVGCLVKAVNEFRAMATGVGSPVPDLPDLLSNCETVMAANGQHDTLSGIPGLFEGYRDAAISWALELGGKVDERFLHRTTVLEELPGLPNGADIQTVLRELYRDMVNNNQNVNQSSVTLGTVTAEGSNNGNGTVLLDKVLDGVNPPSPGLLANWEYNAVNSELAVTSDTMSWTCIQSEDSSGTPEGEEVFTWKGNPRQGEGDWRTEGWGVDLQVPTLNSYAFVANRNFESWSSNVPTSWELDAGVAGTNVIQEASAADVYRGTSALEIAGDGSTTSIQLSQTLPIRSLVPRQRYCLAVRVKGDATIAVGQLNIQFESPSGAYTPSSSEKIQMDAVSLAAQTSYGLESFYINVPDTVPDDLELVIKVTGALTNSATIHIDSLAFGPVTYGNGVNCVVVAGSTQFANGDRLTAPITNNDAGVFQKYMRMKYGVQLPSDGSPSLADSLAT